MYVPLRRAFIKPISAFYGANYTSGQSAKEVAANITVSDMVKEITHNSVGLFDELRPRNVTGDSVKDYIKDEDYRSREQHYFDYIRSNKQEIIDEIGKFYIFNF